MYKVRFTRSAMTVAIWAAVGSLYAQAAPESGSSGGALEETIVTASRNQQRVFDSPVSLSVISQKELDRLGIGRAVQEAKIS